MRAAAWVSSLKRDTEMRYFFWTVTLRAVIYYRRYIALAVATQKNRLVVWRIKRRPGKVVEKFRASRPRLEVRRTVIVVLFIQHFYRRIATLHGNTTYNELETNAPTQSPSIKSFGTWDDKP